MPLPKEDFKVFISHATTEDGMLVDWIAEALDRLHVRAFVYERYPRGGQNRFETIKTMIEACPYFLVVLTKAGITSQWVNQEIGYAVAVGRAPIPIVEVDTVTGRRIESKGFVELNDPIDYYRNEDIRLMADVIYSLYGSLQYERKWKDSVFLSCECGNEFEGELQFDENWGTWVQCRTRFDIPWRCDSCGRTVVLSFPDCHLVTQEY